MLKITMFLLCACSDSLCSFQLEDVDCLAAFGFADDDIGASPSASLVPLSAAAAGTATAVDAAAVPTSSTQPLSSSSATPVPLFTLDSLPASLPNSTALSSGSMEDDATKLHVQHEIFVKATVFCAVASSSHCFNEAFAG
jgi:hypothetical protein